MKSEYSQHRRHHVPPCTSRVLRANFIHPGERFIIGSISASRPANLSPPAIASGLRLVRLERLPRPFHSGAGTLRKIGIDHDLHTVDDDLHARRFRCRI